MRVECRWDRSMCTKTLGAYLTTHITQIYYSFYSLIFCFISASVLISLLYCCFQYQEPENPALFLSLLVVIARDGFSLFTRRILASRSAEVSSTRAVQHLSFPKAQSQLYAVDKVVYIYDWELVRPCKDVGVARLDQI